MINRLEFKSIKRGVNLESVLRCDHVELRRSEKDQYRAVVRFTTVTDLTPSTRIWFETFVRGSAKAAGK